jgi:hypothetical protein
MNYSASEVVMSWTTGVRVPARIGYFLHHHTQTACGFHPVSYRLRTEGTFPGDISPEK